MTIARLSPRITRLTALAIGAVTGITGMAVAGSVNAWATQYAASAVISGAATGLEYPSGITTDADGFIYVSNQGSTRTVSVYSPTASGNAAPLRTLQFASGVQPSCLDTDSLGNLYVCLNDGTVAAYAPASSGQATPLRVLDMPTGYLPISMAIDEQDRLYVSGNNSFNSRIDRYAAFSSGAATPTLSITGISFQYLPYGLDVDSAGNLYVIRYDYWGNGHCEFYVYPANATAPSRTFNAPFAWDVSIGADGYAYVSRSSPQGSVAVFEAGTSPTLSSSPVQTLTIAGMTDPSALSVATDGRIVLANFLTSEVFVLDPMAASGEGPPPVLQQVGMPDTMKCTDVDDSHLNWSGVRSGGWTPSWAQWVRDGQGGPVCGRWLTYVSATGHWRSGS